MDNVKERIVNIPSLLDETSVSAGGLTAELDDGWSKDNTVEEKMPKKEKTCDREQRNIYELLEKEIMSSDLPDTEKAKRMSYLLRIRNRKVNIMLAGATGSGKSSTINAMFDMEMAKVGVGVDPETMDIEKFELDNLVIWDTPGLGDGVESDKRITRQIIRKLAETDEDGTPLIDMVMVVLDASSKDMGTSYDLINHVLIPCLGKDAEKRILLGLNQSDIAMKGKHWDAEKNEPDDVLREFLKNKADSVRKRIREATGLDICPICYCAGYKEAGGEQCKPYNLAKLLCYMLQSVPGEKRLVFVDNINPDEDNWSFDDGEEDYRGEIRQGFFDTVLDSVLCGAETGGEIGTAILGIPGTVIGGVIGAAAGVIGGLFSAVFG